MIEESKILDFIKRNDKRIGSALNKYDDLIKRLLIDEKISLNAIYEFIFENDENIGNKANFYKYCKRFKSKEKKPKEDKKQNTTPLPKPITQNVKDILSQNFDLLEFPK